MGLAVVRVDRRGVKVDRLVKLGVTPLGFRWPLGQELGSSGIDELNCWSQGSFNVGRMVAICLYPLFGRLLVGRVRTKDGVRARYSDVVYGGTTYADASKYEERYASDNAGRTCCGQLGV